MVTACDKHVYLKWVDNKAIHLFIFSLLKSALHLAKLFGFDNFNMHALAWIFFFILGPIVKVTSALKLPIFHKFALVLP